MSCAVEGVSLFEFEGKSLETEAKMFRISHRRESLCRANTWIRRKKQMQESRTVFVVWDLSRKVNQLIINAYKRKIITKFARSISSTRIGYSDLMIDVN